VSETLSRVAMFHNEYAEPGGEDLSAMVDASLLRQRGVEVQEYHATNRVLVGGSRADLARTVWRSHFNREVYDSVRQFCRRYRPQVGHVQNFWFALSPAVHAACHDEGVATVQTLRNYRLLCVNGFLMRNGGPCEDCVGRAPWRGILHACYRESRVASAFVARMIQYNRWRGTWNNDVDVFVALTPFARGRFIAGGLPADRIALKPNTVADPGPVQLPGTGAIFVGRLSPEKGIDLLLAAWESVPDVHLTIAGDGPLRNDVERAAARSGHITFLGQQSPPECLDAIRRSAMLVMASRWYEGFPRVIVEAYALGRPVVAPRLGSMADLVRAGVTGLLFEPGSAVDLASCVKKLAGQPAMSIAMSRGARAEYESEYAPATNADQLVNIYRAALKRFYSSRYARSPAN
jgi:glycosyltransferase involved in cell wall biosynthesis